MSDAATTLLLALARGRLGDFGSDLATLRRRRDMIAGMDQSDGSPLWKRRPSLQELDAAIGEANAKIATLARMIDAVEGE